ncbi:GNAT family N-acetyltransferase [Bacillus toyonensis]|nr:GNAT family protein [Bacillus toyonensis]
MVIIQKDNLLIREIKASDIELIRSWRNRSDIKKNFIDTDTISESQQQLWYKNYLMKPDDIMFIIEEKNIFKSAIGTAALYNIKTKEQTVEFGRLIVGHMPAQRKGFGKQATMLVCKYAFDVLKSKQINLTVLHDNIKAIQLYLKIGFIITNTTFDVVHMSLNKNFFLNSSSV